MLPTFASPEWLWCLLLLPPLAGLRLWAQYRARRGAAGLVSPRLRGDLIVGAHPWAAWGIFSLRLLALAALLTAMARPQLGYTVTDTETEGRNVILAIDTSRSMLANDLQPDRLTRARLAAQDIVNALPEDRIGLIAFAGKAFLQAPLTLDHDAIIEAIQQFDTEIIPRGGTNLASAVGLALETFEKTGNSESALILFSDGENLEGEEEMEQVRKTAAELGTVLVAVGVGSETGAIIPEPDEKGRPQPGVFITDDQGGVVRSRLDPTALQALSRDVGGGVYVNLGATTSIAAVVETALEKIEATRQTAKAQRQPIERFMWPLSLAFLLMVAAFLLPGTVRVIGRLLAPRQRPASMTRRPPRLARTPILAASALFLAGAAGTVCARQGDESAGFASLQKKEYDTAIDAFEHEIAEAQPGKRQAWLHLGLGSAAYRKGDYELAMNAFGKALEQPYRQLSETAHYNLGNTLYRHGEAVLQNALEGGGRPDLPQVETDPDKEAIAKQWRSAIEHYEQALKINPGNNAARYNLEVVKKRLELLQQPPPEQEQNQQEQEKEKEEEQNQQNQQQEKDKEQDQEPQQQPQQPQQPPQSPQGQDQEQPNQPDNPPPGDQQPPDSPPEQNPNPNQGDDNPQNQGNQPPPPPSPPTPDGELEAKPDQSNPQNPEPAEPSDRQVNPDTGFSPSEARQKLRTLADEDKDVRPPERIPMRAQKFKNW